MVMYSPRESGNGGSKIRGVPDPESSKAIVYFGSGGAALGAATSMFMRQSAPSLTSTQPKLPDCVFPACSPEPVNWNSPTLQTPSPVECASLILRVSVVQPALMRAATAFSILAWPL